LAEGEQGEVIVIQERSEKFPGALRKENPFWMRRGSVERLHQLSSHLPEVFCRNWHLAVDQCDLGQVVEASSGRSLRLSG
jgi:hypothetical protein